MDDDLSLLRINKAETALDVRPVDVLRALISEIERGILKPKNVMVLLTEEDANGIHYITYRASMTRIEELTRVQVEVHRVWERMRR